MFNLGFSELLILGVIALIFIGPKELPEIARVIGRMLNELKRATGDLTQTILEPKEQFRREMEKLKSLDPHHGDPLPSAEEILAQAHGPKTAEPEVKAVAGPEDKKTSEPT